MIEFWQSYSTYDHTWPVPIRPDHKPVLRHPDRSWIVLTALDYSDNRSCYVLACLYKFWPLFICMYWPFRLRPDQNWYILILFIYSNLFWYTLFLVLILTSHDQSWQWRIASHVDGQSWTWVMIMTSQDHEVCLVVAKQQLPSLGTVHRYLTLHRY